MSRIDEELFLELQWFFVALEVEPVSDDMQFDVTFILEATLTQLDQLEVLIANEIGLFPSYFLPGRQFSLPEVFGAEDIQFALPMERVSAYQQDKHSKFGLISIATRDLQIGLLSLGEHTADCPIMEYVRISGGNVFGGVMHHFYVYLLISEADLVLEEGPAERPFLQSQVNQSLEGL